MLHLKSSGGQRTFISNPVQERRHERRGRWLHSRRALGSEEMDSWRHPAQSHCAHRARYPVWLRRWRPAECGVAPGASNAALGRAVLGEDPEAIFSALSAALGAGATPTDVARAVAFAAALRIAHFGTRALPDDTPQSEEKGSPV